MDEAAKDNPTSISRRQFLKLSATSYATVALPDFLLNLDIDKWPELDTEFATFIPLYEIHEKGVTLRDIQKVGGLTTFFIEAVNTSNSVIHTPAQDVLYKWQAAFKSWGKLESTGTFFDDDVVAFFSKKDIYVAVEGMAIPERLDLLSKTVGSVERLLAAFLLTNEVLRKPLIRMLKKEKPTQRDVNRIIASLAYSAWADLPGAPAVTAGFLESKRSQGELPSATQETLQKIAGKTSFFHPEDLTVFFRNIIMARKLTTIAKEEKVRLEEKPVVAFNVGLGHAGVEEILKQKEGFSLYCLSLYPTELLRQIVEANGGIDTFCSTVIFPARETVREGTDTKKILVDRELKEYLEERLKPLASVATSVASDTP